MNTALAYAKAYAAQGWPVLPLRPGSKAPGTPRGFKDASTDPGTLESWFTATPDAGVGIYPGPAHLLVLDVDHKNGAAGPETIERLQAQHGTLPATLKQKTPSGAFHLVYRLPQGLSFGNAQLGSGIDVRCAAGYIGAEPTRIRMDGGAVAGYAFEDWDVLAGEVPEIADAPAWLLRLLTAGTSLPATDAPQHDAARESITPRQVTELRSALNALSADDYHEWIAVGNALKGLGSVGRELWVSWSQQSDKWKPVDAQKWATFKPERTGYASVFARAQRAGWANPASKAAPIGVAAAQEASSSAAGSAMARAWRMVPVEDLDTATVPPQAWLWEGYIPGGTLTLLGAHGGTGKSTIALMLAVCAALGLPLFGVPTQAAPVVFYSAEDDGDTVRRRLQAICRALDVAAAQLAGRLFVLDMSDQAPELYGMGFAEDGLPKLGATPSALALQVFLAECRAGLLIVDNASDTMGGNENARPDVRAFVRLLVGMVRGHGGAALLLAHIDKSAAKGFGAGESYSGSTAWHNSARSRLTLKRDKTTGDLVLEHEKSNYGPTREPLRLVWPRDRLPELEAPASGVVLAISTDNNSRALLRLLHEFTKRGEYVSTATTSRTHAGRLLRGQPGFPRSLSDGELFDLLRRAERRGWLQKQAYRGLDRKHRERWEVTSAGAEVAAIPDFAATAATAATSVVTAEGAAPAEPCGDCGDFAAGGVGGRVRTEVAAGARP